MVIATNRYLVRVEEMRQRNRIVKQCIEWLRANPGPVITANHKVASADAPRNEGEHGRVIHHFKLFSEASTCPPAKSMRQSNAERRIRRLCDSGRRQQRRIG
jgi:NADH-quinone oxidoreductase subunit D